MHRIHKIKGIVQHYSWGGYDFIPDLLQLEKEVQKPYAEYWLGDHPKGPSIVQDEDDTSLSALIKTAPADILGAAGATSLPFLFKILDVRQMLSIQVHPDKQSANTGFEEEERNAIPIGAPHRNYKDRNHKPEMMIALSEFWLLHGFKSQADLLKELHATPELNFLVKQFEQGGYKPMFEEVMQLPQERVNAILAPLAGRIVPLFEAGELKKDDANFWAAKAMLHFCTPDCFDRGIFSIYFLNLLHLQKGEGVFQPAGMLHAYLEGQNLEVMANSDNVLRAGLTDKHVDVAGLMRHVNFWPVTPVVIDSSKAEDGVIKVPAPEFALAYYRLNTDHLFHTEHAEIILVMEGTVQLEQLRLGRGEAAFIFANTDVLAKPLGPVALYRVFTPKKGDQN